MTRDTDLDAFAGETLARRGDDAVFPLFRLNGDLVRTKLHRGERPAPSPQMYQVSDRLQGRTVSVPGPEIAAAVAAWLADFDVHSPLVDALADAARAGDWAAARAIGECLSVDVSFAS